MRVFVLLFNARTENEGIHTIKTFDADRGERNLVLMFESEDDATRFALMLEAQDFPTATVEALLADEIEEFCREADYDCRLVREGVLAIPPDQNMEETDWQADRKSTELSEDELNQLRRRFEGLL